MSPTYARPFPRKTLAPGEVVRGYKGLEQVERAFGTFKGPELALIRLQAHALDLAANAPLTA